MPLLGEKNFKYRLLMKKIFEDFCKQITIITLHNLQKISIFLLMMMMMTVA